MQRFFRICDFNKDYIRFKKVGEDEYVIAKIGDEIYIKSNLQENKGILTNISIDSNNRILLFNNNFFLLEKIQDIKIIRRNSV